MLGLHAKRLRFNSWHFEIRQNPSLKAIATWYTSVQYFLNTLTHSYVYSRFEWAKKGTVSKQRWDVLLCIEIQSTKYNTIVLLSIEIQQAQVFENDRVMHV